MFRQKKRDEFAADWRRMIEETPQSVRQSIDAMVERHAAELADLFYQSMLADEEARPFLNFELVDQRLNASMQAWLRELFAPGEQDPQLIYKHQSHVGEVHARIQIPIALVMRGARLLKHAITGYLVESALDRSDLVKAANFVSETIELALDAMTDSYVVDLEKHARADEAYRMFALGQNMLAERERQRAALLEWAQQVLLGMLSEPDDQPLPDIRHSEFGMWLQHKAVIVFEGAPELDRIQQRVNGIDELMLKAGTGGDSRLLMKQMEEGIAEIKFLLGGLFDRFIEVESGRDSLTRLLNRRYLPSVLTREMAMARRSGKPFALLLLDIDHFKKINDSFGHSAGDLVLQQVSDLVTANVRAGDFIFRFGGEELLLVLVEIEKERALQVAETIRQRLAAEPLRVGEGKSVSVTASIGVASYRGHPDYETVIKDADGALYEAKEAGRNCCVLSRR